MTVGNKDIVTIETRENTTQIWVKFDKIGFHRYPDAPDEVAYLRDRHRHVFKFTVAITVFHGDREIEFHMMKNWLLSLYDSGALEVDYKSCEMLGQDLLEKILKKYDCSNRYVMIDVSEDGECGAITTSRPTGEVQVPRSTILEQAGKIQKDEWEAGAALMESKPDNSLPQG